jgi:hypothetical protein
MTTFSRIVPGSTTKLLMQWLLKSTLLLTSISIRPKDEICVTVHGKKELPFLRRSIEYYSVNPGLILDQCHYLFSRMMLPMLNGIRSKIMRVEESLLEKSDVPFSISKLPHLPIYIAYPLSNSTLPRKIAPPCPTDSFGVSSCGIIDCT